MRRSIFATGLLVLGLAAPTLAGAQSTPAPIVLPTIPPNSPDSGWIQTGVNAVTQILQRAHQTSAGSAHGTVTYFRRFDMQVQTANNSYRTVRLHQGTIINPRGGTPSVGSTVDVYGNADANGVIDAGTITIDR